MMPLQRLLLRAAVSNIPDAIREKIGLEHCGLRPGEETLVRFLGKTADRIVLDEHPAVKACGRLGLSRDYLFKPIANDNDPIPSADFVVSAPRLEDRAP